MTNKLQQQGLLAEAQAEGAAALRYRAERLAGIEPLDAQAQALIEYWREAARLLDEQARV